MAKKDFTQVNTERVYSTINDATKGKERKTYTPAETEEFTEAMKTRGRKGTKLPRINMAFSPTNHDYIMVMARVTGQTATSFVNEIVDQYREEHQDLYQKAQEIINSL